MPVVSVVLLLAAPSLQQGPEATRRIQEAAQSARAIARDIGLPDWGLRLLQDEAKNAKTDEDRAELDLGTCDVLRLKAAYERDPAKRLEILAAAGAAYSRLLDQYASTLVAQRAQGEVGLTAYNFSVALDQLFATGGVSEAQRSDLIAKVEPFFKSAMKAMNEFVSYWVNLPDDSEEKENLRFTLYYPTQFYRGIVYTSWARLYPPESLEREAHSSKALELLDDFALSAGLAYGMNAYKLAADVRVLRGELDQAKDYYEYVITTSRDTLADVNPADPLDETLIAHFQGAVQDATLGLVEMLRGAGRADEAAAAIQDFEKWMRDGKVPPQEGGFRVRLIEALDLVDAGRIGEALGLAQDVARENQTNAVIRLQANAAMSYAILNAPPEAEIPLDILFQAADGSQQSGEFEQAASFWREMIGRLPGHAKEREYKSRAYINLAICWHQLGDPLLAGSAAAAGFRAGYESDADGATLAKQWFSRADSFFRSRPSDAVLQQWQKVAREAVESVTRGDTTPDGILRAAAISAETSANTFAGAAKDAKPDSPEAQKAVSAFREAAAAWSKIQPGSRYYDEALAGNGRCLYRALKWDPAIVPEAIEALEAYLEHAANPSNAPRDAAERKSRKDNEPATRYYLIDSWRIAAKAGEPGAWDEVLARSEGFAEKYQEEQRDLADSVRDIRIEAFLALSRAAEAEAEFDALQKSGAKDSRLSAAAWKLQNHFARQADAAEKAGDAAAAEAQLKKCVQYLGLMNQKAPAPSGNSLYREASLRFDLREWANAEKLVSTALDGAAVPLEEQYRFHATVMLVRCLLNQRHVGRAVPLVERLRAQSPKDQNVLELTIKVNAGFLIVENNQILEVLGANTPESLQIALDAANTLEQLAANDAATAGENKFRSPGWWNARLEQIYVIHLIGRLDPTRADEAKRIIASIEAQAPDLGESIAGKDVARMLRWIQQR